MSEQLRVGLIGFGFSGRVFHAPVMTVIPQISLVQVVERNSRKSQERYPWIEVVSSVEALLKDESIELIVVATPTNDHYHTAKAALLAGKHVVIEKPFTTTTVEADELIALAKRQNRIVSVYHNRRWDGDFLTVSSLLRQKRLGELISCEFNWDRYNPIIRPERWREKAILGAGTLYDLGVHFFDQALCLFGKPRTISADVRILREGGAADDYFDVTLDYQTFKVHLGASNLMKEPRPRYIITGSNGTYVKCGTDPQEEALIAGRLPTMPDWGAESQENWGVLHRKVGDLAQEEQVETLRGSYTSYYQNIYDVIKRKAELLVKPEEARQTIQLVELAFQSDREKRVLDVKIT